MKLSPDLDALLCARYPALFANRGRDPQDFPMGWGFEIGPGWFALVDTVSALLSARQLCRAQQVKSKGGSLVFRIEPCPTSPSAIDLATAISQRVCEVTGRPGRLHRYLPFWLTTLAPKVRLPGREGIPEAVLSVLDRATPGFYIPPIGFSLEEMATLRAGVLAESASIPVGWYELADTVLQLLQRSPGPPRVRRLLADDDGLRVEWDGDCTKLAELSEMVTFLSRRIDQVTGAMA